MVSIRTRSLLPNAGLAIALVSCSQPTGTDSEAAALGEPFVCEAAVGPGDRHLASGAQTILEAHAARWLEPTRSDPLPTLDERAALLADLQAAGAVLGAVDPDPVQVPPENGWPGTGVIDLREGWVDGPGKIVRVRYRRFEPSIGPARVGIDAVNFVEWAGPEELDAFHRGSCLPRFADPCADPMRQIVTQHMSKWVDAGHVPTVEDPAGFEALHRDLSAAGLIEGGYAVDRYQGGADVRNGTAYVSVDDGFTWKPRYALFRFTTAPVLTLQTTKGTAVVGALDGPVPACH